MTEFFDLPQLERYSFRSSESHREKASVAFGIELPHLACRATIEGERAALWLGPDEWLLIGAGYRLQNRDFPNSLVDISHRQVGIHLSGDNAATMLNMACPLDLDEAVFSVGMCSRTVFGKAEIILWRKGAEIFHIEVWRSFSNYVSALLTVAQQEHV